MRHPLRGAQRRSSQLPQRLPGREWDTRDGIMEVSIPKLRAGSCFPDWLLERRRRAERALTTVVATCYLLGVSTGRMEKLVETLGITRLFKSQVSVMAKELDEHSGEFRSCPLDAGVHMRGRRRPGPEGPRGWPGGQRARPGGHRRQRRPAPRDPGRGGHLSRGRFRLAGLPSGPY